MIVNHFPDRTIQVDKKEYLYFGGTAYLGLPTHTQFQENLIEGVKKWGTFYGSSRNSNVKLSVFNKVEALFANQIGAQASLTTSSGTLAGKLVVEYFSKLNYTFYHYPKTHPSILDKNSYLLFKKEELHPNLFTSKEENIVITVDAVLGLEVKPTSFTFLSKIPTHKKITLLVDESHSLGIVGKNGAGVFNTIPDTFLKRKIMVSSLSKALGLSGGVIASDKNFIEIIKNEALFVSSSCANSAYLDAYLNSQEIIIEQQLILNENLDFLFHNLDKTTELKFDKNYPVLYSENDTIYNFLKEKGIIIANFKYPTYKNFMNRIVITANHTKADLLLLSKALNALINLLLQ